MAARSSSCRRIVQGGEKLGTIYLRAQYDITGRVLAYLSVLGAVMLVGLVAALLAVELAAARGEPAHGVDGNRGAPDRRAPRLLVPRRTRPPTTRSAWWSTRSTTCSTRCRRARARSKRSEKLYRAIGESINYGVWVTRRRKAAASTPATLSSSWSASRSSRPPNDRLGQRAASRTTRPTRWPPGRNARAPATSGTASTACWASTASTTPILAQGVPIRDESGRVAALGRHQSRHQPTEEHRTRAARSRPAQGRVPRDAGARAAQSAGADPQRRAHPRFGGGRRAAAQVGPRGDRAPGAAHVAAARRSARRLAHHARPARAQARLRRSEVRR